MTDNSTADADAREIITELRQAFGDMVCTFRPLEDQIAELHARGPFDHH
jgi:hypothetical protein